MTNINQQQNLSFTGLKISKTNHYYRTLKQKCFDSSQLETKRIVRSIAPSMYYKMETNNNEILFTKTEQYYIDNLYNKINKYSQKTSNSSLWAKTKNDAINYFMKIFNESGRFDNKISSTFELLVSKQKNALEIKQQFEALIDKEFTVIPNL